MPRIVLVLGVRRANHFNKWKSGAHAICDMAHPLNLKWGAAVGVTRPLFIGQPDEIASCDQSDSPVYVYANPPRSEVY